MMRIDIVPPSENYKGMSYADWATVWSKWLISEDPDNSVPTGILFTRGNVNYGPLGGLKGGPLHLNSRSTFYKIGSAQETILPNTAIFIPVLTSQWSVGSIFDGKKIRDELELRYCLNKDLDETRKMWAYIRLTKRGAKNIRLVRNLAEYRIESRMFRLNIPKKSLLNNKTENPMKPGNHDTIIGGYFVLLRSLPLGSYRITFGGFGRGDYYTNAVYDIIVLNKLT